MPTIPLTLLIAATVGLAAGYLLTPTPITAPTHLPPPPKPSQTATSTSTPTTSLLTESTAFIDQLANATADDLPAILDTLLAHWRNNRGELFHLKIGPLIERWVALDPAAGTRYALSVGRSGIASAIFYAWAQKDPQAALAAADTWDPEERRPALTAAALNALAESDPAAALNALAESDPAAYRERVLAGISPDFTLGANQLRTIVSDLTRSSLDDALAFVDALPKGNHQTALNAIAETLARTNPTAATEWAIAITDRENHDSALREIARTIDPEAAKKLLGHFHSTNDFPSYSIAKKMAESDPAKALDWILTVDKKHARRSAAQLFVGELAHSSPHAAFANLDRILDSLPEGDRNLYNTATNNFRNFDPQVLPELAAAVTPETNPGAIAAVAREWIRQDPEAALAWLAEIVPTLPGDSGRLANSIVSSFRYIDSAKLPTISSRLAPLTPHLNPDTAKQLARHLSRSDDPAVADVFFSQILPDFPSPQSASSGFEKVDDPFAEHTIGPDSLVAAFVFPRFKRLAEADPLDAVAQASSLTDPQRRRLAFSSTAANWVAYAPQAASTWASDLPQGTDRDHAAAGIAGNIANSDPSAALIWAAAITAADLRTTTATRAIQDMPASSLADTAGLIPTLGLPAQEQNALLTAIEARLEQAK